jgi:hypothetical protein
MDCVVLAAGLCDGCLKIVGIFAVSSHSLGLARPLKMIWSVVQTLEVLMSRRKRSQSRGRRSTIPAPPASESSLTQIEQEWDRILSDYLPEESRRIFV